MKKTVSKKPAKKASPKKITQKKSKIAKKGAVSAPKKKVSAKKTSAKEEAERGRGRKDWKNALRSDGLDDVTRVDDVAAYNDDQPSPQDEDAEASAFATGGED